MFCPPLSEAKRAPWRPSAVEASVGSICDSSRNLRYRSALNEMTPRDAAFPAPVVDVVSTRLTLSVHKMCVSCIILYYTILHIGIACSTATLPMHRERHTVVPSLTGHRSHATVEVCPVQSVQTAQYWQIDLSYLDCCVSAW